MRVVGRGERHELHHGRQCVSAWAPGGCLQIKFHRHSHCRSGTEQYRQWGGNHMHNCVGVWAASRKRQVWDSRHHYVGGWAFGGTGQGRVHMQCDVGTCAVVERPDCMYTLPAGHVCWSRVYLWWWRGRWCEPNITYRFRVGHQSRCCIHLLNSATVTTVAHICMARQRSYSCGGTSSI